MIKTLKPVIQAHPFFADMPDDFIELVVSCARNLRFEAGTMVMREGEDADDFFLIRRGRILLSTHGVQRGPLPIQTLGEGEMVGWSWLVPPYHYRFDAKAIETTMALVFDGKCLRDKCEERPELGYALLKRVAAILAKRLETSRIQLLDVYGTSQSQL